jgi:hypothetical protein
MRHPVKPGLAQGVSESDSRKTRPIKIHRARRGDRKGSENHPGYSAGAKDPAEAGSRHLRRLRPEGSQIEAEEIRAGVSPGKQLHRREILPPTFGRRVRGHKGDCLHRGTNRPRPTEVSHQSRDQRVRAVTQFLGDPGAILPSLRKARETVMRETPAFSATAFMVTGLPCFPIPAKTTVSGLPVNGEAAPDPPEVRDNAPFRLPPQRLRRSLRWSASPPRSPPPFI